MILIVALSRYVSLASLVAALVGSLSVIGLAIWNDFPWWWAVAITAISGIIVIQHRGNIVRLLSGTERKFGARETASPSHAG
jgi:glycerol-3-phosphate acyltransferase PlsY